MAKSLHSVTCAYNAKDAIDSVVLRYCIDMLQIGYNKWDEGHITQINTGIHSVDPRNTGHSCVELPKWWLIPGSYLSCNISPHEGGKEQLMDQSLAYICNLMLHRCILQTHAAKLCYPSHSFHHPQRWYFIDRILNSVYVPQLLCRKSRLSLFIAFSAIIKQR